MGLLGRPVPAAPLRAEAQPPAGPSGHRRGAHDAATDRDPPRQGPGRARRRAADAAPDGLRHGAHRDRSAGHRRRAGPPGRRHRAHGRARSAQRPGAGRHPRPGGRPLDQSAGGPGTAGPAAPDHPPHRRRSLDHRRRRGALPALGLARGGPAPAGRTARLDGLAPPRLAGHRQADRGSARLALPHHLGRLAGQGPVGPPGAVALHALARPRAPGGARGRHRRGAARPDPEPRPLPARSAGPALSPAGAARPARCRQPRPGRRPGRPTWHGGSGGCQRCRSRPPARRRWSRWRRTWCWRAVR